MKKYFFVAIILFANICLLTGQVIEAGSTSFTISQLSTFAECPDLNCFDRKIRLFGYTFEKFNQDKQYYIYIKVYTKGEWTVENRIVYKKGFVDFSQISIANPDYLNQIKKEVEIQRLSLIKGFPLVEGKKLIFRYENNIAYIEIHDDPKSEYSVYNVCVILKK